MSKKTKREKMLALYRNKVRLLQKEQQPISIIQNKPSPSAIYQTYFFKDFKRSIILIAIILAIEIVLYYGTINNYLRLF